MRPGLSSSCCSHTLKQAACLSHSRHAICRLQQSQSRSAASHAQRPLRQRCRAEQRDEQQADRPTENYPLELTSRDEQPSQIQRILAPDPAELPNDFNMPIWDHLEELRERILIGGLAAVVAIAVCFGFAKDLVVFLEAPVAQQGVRFLQLSPGEFFFTTFKVAGYAGLLLATPTVLYEVISYVVPGLTKSEKQLLAPVMFGSSALFFIGILFAYEILTPAALNFFVSYSDGAVESLWSIDQYFEFVVVLLLGTGLSFQVPVVQVLLGKFGLVTSKQFFAQWRYVVVGATIAAAVLTPSTDPFTQTLLAVPLIGLYLGGAGAVRFFEKSDA